MTLTMIIGGLGAGKTLFSTILACNVSQPVYSNYKIDAPNYHPFDLNQFLNGNYDNCLLLLDEAYVYLDSRLPGRLLNRVLSYVLFQSRKMGMEIIVTTQLYSTLDVRFRELADYVTKARRTGKGFQYRIKNVETGIVKSFFLHEHYAGQFYNRFDTMERVEPVEDMNAVKRFTVPTGEKLNSAQDFGEEVLKQITDEFGEDQKPTHDLVDFYCEALEVAPYLRKMVYICANKEFKKREKQKEKEVVA